MSSSFVCVKVTASDPGTYVPVRYLLKIRKWRFFSKNLVHAITIIRLRSSLYILLSSYGYPNLFHQFYVENHNSKIKVSK